jgi:predicted phage terminase large subunit-like protein
VASPAPQFPENHPAVRNPDLALLLLEAAEAEHGLKAYTKLVWPVLEPGRRLVYGWHMDAIGEHLEAVTAGEIKRLVINVPPGFSKSLMTNVLWPSWEWGPRDMPFLRYLSFAYAQQLTIRDNRRCRNLINSQLYQLLWGDRFGLVSDQNAKIRYDTDQAGFRLASSVGGTGTGERGDRIVIDDPNNVRESESEKITDSTLTWLSEVVPSRTTDIRTSAIVLIQQRTGVNDCTGHILKSQLGYEWLCLPMEYERANPCFTPVRRKGVRPRKVRLVQLEEESVPTWTPAAKEPDALVAWSSEPRMLTAQDRRTKDGELLDPDRFPRDAIEQDLKKPLRSRGGEAAVAGQLGQRPQPRGGTMFHREAFHFILPRDLPKGLRWAAGYDLAGSKTNTTSASARVKIAVDIREDRVFIGDVDRVFEESGAVVKWMQDHAKADGKACAIDYPQDPGQAGKWQKGFLGGKLAGYAVFSSPESGDKEDRAQPLASQVELGNVYLVRGPWCDAFIAEAVNFPRGTFKDQIDAASRAYARALKRAKRAPRSAAPKLIR